MPEEEDTASPCRPKLDAGRTGSVAPSVSVDKIGREVSLTVPRRDTHLTICGALNDRIQRYAKRFGLQ